MKNNKQNIIYLIIFFAGFSFLIYEVAWNRYLSFILGTTVTASTIILTSVMTGFGLGALILGKVANSTQNPGKLLSGILAGIGIFNIINFLLISNLLTSFYSSFSNVLFADIIFFSVVFLLLLIPAFFMGGVIPLINKIVITENKNIEKKLGKVYAFETFGSMSGGIITGFILLGNIGQIQTIFTAGIINLLLAIYIFLSKSYSKPVKIGISQQKNNNSQENANKSKKIAKISALLFGFSVLSLQIIWIRIFRIYFTNTSYTFTLITSLIILGISLGSWFYKKKGKSIKNNETTMLKAIIIFAFIVLTGFFILHNLPEMLMFPFSDLMANTFVRIIILPATASFLIVFMPAVVSGFAFPLACKMYSGGAENISQNIGKILTFNSIGSATGPVIATFLLIPFLGVGKAILLIIVAILLTATYISLQIKDESKVNNYKKILIVLSAGIFISIFIAGQLQFVPPSVKKFNKKIIAYNETTEGTLVVVDEPQKGVFGKSTFVNNSSVIGSNYDAVKAVKMVGHLPFFAGLQCKKVLIIGFGIGVTTSAIASHKEVQSIDCVELVPDLVKSAKNYKDFNSLAVHLSACPHKTSKSI